MACTTNTSLRKAVDDLSQVLNSSLGANKDCMQAIANIKEMLNSIEYKLSGLSNSDFDSNDSALSNETTSFAPDIVGSVV